MELLDKAGVKDVFVMSLLRDYYFSMMNKQVSRINSLFASKEPFLDEIKQTAGQICEAADRLQTESEKLNV